MVISSIGDVLYALDRRSVDDLVSAWERLLPSVAPTLTPQSATIHVWGRDPWKRISDSIILALCHHELPSGHIKWKLADSEVRSWVLSYYHGYLKELHIHTNLTEYDVVEDGSADAQRIGYLEVSIDRYGRFSGVIV